MISLVKILAVLKATTFRLWNNISRGYKSTLLTSFRNDVPTDLIHGNNDEGSVFWITINDGLSVFKQGHRCHADADDEAEVSDGRPSNLLHHDAAYSGGDSTGQVEQRRADANHGTCKDENKAIFNSYDQNLHVI